MLSVKVLCLKIGAGCLIEKMSTDRKKRKKENIIHSKTNTIPIPIYHFAQNQLYTISNIVRIIRFRITVVILLLLF